MLPDIRFRVSVRVSGFGFRGSSYKRGLLGYEFRVSDLGFGVGLRI